MASCSTSRVAVSVPSKASSWHRCRRRSSISLASSVVVRLVLMCTEATGALFWYKGRRKPRSMYVRGACDPCPAHLLLGIDPYPHLGGQGVFWARAAVNSTRVCPRIYLLYSRRRLCLTERDRELSGVGMAFLRSFEG